MLSSTVCTVLSTLPFHSLKCYPITLPTAHVCAHTIFTTYIIMHVLTHHCLSLHCQGHVLKTRSWLRHVSCSPQCHVHYHRVQRNDRIDAKEAAHGQDCVLKQARAQAHQQSHTHRTVRVLNFTMQPTDKLNQHSRAIKQLHLIINGPRKTPPCENSKCT